MRKSTIITIVIALSLLLFMLLALKTCMIQNPKPDECVIVQIEVIDITKRGANDIVFHDNGTDYYYINRGLERGLHLDSLKTKVLNKTVTLHLAKVLGGITSEHISQLALDDGIIFTEFN